MLIVSSPASRFHWEDQYDWPHGAGIAGVLGDLVEQVGGQLSDPAGDVAGSHSHFYFGEAFGGRQSGRGLLELAFLGLNLFGGIHQTGLDEPAENALWIGSKLG